MLAQPNADTPGRALGIASVANLRDVGGYAAHEGAVVETKLLYRSNQLSKITPGDLKKIAALSLKNEYDLRTGQNSLRERYLIRQVQAK